MEASLPSLTSHPVLKAFVSLSISSTFITHATQRRKRVRILPRMALALATLATAGLFNAAHATYPGENGVIVFEYGNTRVTNGIIRRVSPGNSAMTDLGTGSYPSVSPNGKKVAFRKNWDIYVMDIDGSNVVQLTSVGNADSPAWLPDGSKVVYARGPMSTPFFQLWSVNPDGTNNTFLRQLDITPSNSPGFDLAWSPSGNIYTFTGGGDRILQGLNISDDVNPAIRQLSPMGSGGSWAPDGQSILYQYVRGDQFEINPDGSNLREVPSSYYISLTSAISPDGAFIAGNAGSLFDGQKLMIRLRAGTPSTFSWSLPQDSISLAVKTDWSRVPKNCYTSTPEGGGGVLAGDEDFYASQCAVAVMPDDGRNGVLQQAIAVGPDQRLYHRMLLKASSFGGTPTWTGFTAVPGGGGSSLGIKAKKIAIAASKDGSAQVVIVNADNNLVYHAMRSAKGAWSGFNLLNGAGAAPNFAARDVAIAIGSSTSTSPGNAQVIANGLDAGGLYHRVRWPDGSWTSFQPIADANTHNIAIAVAENGNANVLATMTAADGSQGQIMQVLRYSSGNWTGWETVGIPGGTTISASSDVAVTRTLSGWAELMFTDSTGNAFFQKRATPEVPTSWPLPVTTTQIAITVGRAVSISAGAIADSSSQMLLTRTVPQ
jgi:hypothetical protein